MIDFAGISGVAGVAAGAFDAIGLAGGAAVTEAGSEAAATGGDLSGMAASFAAAAVATGATAGAALWVTRGSAFAGDAGHRDPGAEEVPEADGAGDGGLAEVAVEGTTGEEGSVEDDAGEGGAIEEGASEEDAIEEGAIEEGWGTGCGEPAAAFCLAIEPVAQIQALFQHGDAGVQPVAVAVQGIDGGGQPSCLVLALLGDQLELLRLSRQIGVGKLLVPQSDRGLMGQHRHDDSADGADAPRSEPP